jgi:dolichyl-phosphate beta-glucosyltransferase
MSAYPPIDVSVIVPAYNEVRQIAATIQELRGYFERCQQSFEIIVAADGTDGTREAASALVPSIPALKVIGHAERAGKGRGVREAMRLTRGRIVGFVDADQKTPIDEFDKFRPLFDDGADLVIGSRALRESVIEKAQPLHRRLGSQVFGLVMRAVVGLSRIPDTQCGFKFFRRDVALDLFTRQRIDGYMFDVEILYLAQQSGYRISQVAVRWRDDGDSRLQLVAGNIRNVADLFRIRFASDTRLSVSEIPAEVRRSRNAGS